MPELFNRLREQELITALRTVTGELERIAAIRYDERLDYCSIYQALETGRTALSHFERKDWTGQRSVGRPAAVRKGDCCNYLKGEPYASR